MLQAQLFTKKPGHKMTVMKNFIKKIFGHYGYMIRKQNTGEKIVASICNVAHPVKNCSLLVLNPSDSIQSRHAHGQFYEEEEIHIIEKYFKGGNFLDIGANVGNHTVYFGLLPSTAKVISFEPHPEAFAILSFNVAFNKLTNKVSYYNYGLSDKAAEVEIKTPLHNLGGSTIEPTIRGQETDLTAYYCSIVVGDEVIFDKINFIKIDVEGHELSCLRGIKKLIIDNKPPIFIEVSDNTEKSVNDFLNDINYHEILRYQRYESVTNIVYLHQKN